MRKFRRNSQAGFTLVEVLLSLSITLLIVGSLMPIFKMVKHSQNISTHDEDVYIAAKQVSQYLLGTYYVQAGKNYQYLDDKNDEWSLVLDHRRLIKKPGFEVMLTDIDDLSFVLKQDWIYMKVKRQKKNYQFLVGFKREKNNEEQTNQ